MENQVLFNSNPWRVVHILFLANAILNFGELSPNHNSDKFQTWHISHYLFFFSYIEILGCGSLKGNQVNGNRGKTACIEFDIS